MSRTRSFLRSVLRVSGALLLSPLVLLGAEAGVLTVRQTGVGVWTLEWRGKTYPCAVGKHGIAGKGEKREGDGKTPSGVFPLRSLYYRADKLEGRRPETPLSAQELTKADGWCDAPGDPEYNRFVRLPYPASHEELWRDKDDLYDLIVPIGYNDDPVVPGRGSAIFLHVAAPGYSPTAGCVALSKPDFLDLLKTLAPGCRIRIRASQP